MFEMWYTYMLVCFGNAKYMLYVICQLEYLVLMS